MKYNHKEIKSAGGKGRALSLQHRNEKLRPSEIFDWDKAIAHLKVMLEELDKSSRS